MNKKLIVSSIVSVICCISIGCTKTYKVGNGERLTQEEVNNLAYDSERYDCTLQEYLDNIEVIRDENGDIKSVGIIDVDKAIEQEKSPNDETIETLIKSLIETPAEIKVKKIETSSEIREYIVEIRDSDFDDDAWTYENICNLVKNMDVEKLRQAVGFDEILAITYEVKSHIQNTMENNYKDNIKIEVKMTDSTGTNVIVDTSSSSNIIDRAIKSNDRDKYDSNYLPTQEEIDNMTDDEFLEFVNSTKNNIQKNLDTKEAVDDAIKERPWLFK